jgi:uracil-DNA glycosylase
MPIKPAPSAAPWIPEHLTPPLLQAASKNCEGCDLFRYATQTVFGEGPPNAAVVMVGEQLGDQEDLAGKPFVGPAVKHFKFVESGKRRIHGKPSGIEISACRPWLEAGLAVIQAGGDRVPGRDGGTDGTGPP